MKREAFFSERRQAASAEFLALLRRTRGDLADFYATETDTVALAAGKAERFRELRRRYERLVEESWNGRDLFGNWFEPPPNNADLALVASYTDGVCAFRALWREVGGDFATFHRRARATAELPEAQRRGWLETPCP